MQIRLRRIVLIAATVACVQVVAEDRVQPDKQPWLNGFTAGRALAGYYQGDNKDEFIRGLLAGMETPQPAAISENQIHEAKTAWIADTTIGKKERASYAAGYLSGESNSVEDALYSPYLFIQGFLDGLQRGDVPYLDEVTGSALVSQYQRSQFYRKKREVADRIAAHERAGRAFLSANAVKPGVVQSDSGLQYRVVTAGNGDRPTAGDTVVVSLVGRKIDGTVFYDSQVDGSGPTTIKVNQALEGWQEALVNMSPGAEWELFLPAQLAYRNAGWKGIVDPGETLIYNLRLIEVIKSR